MAVAYAPHDYQKRAIKKMISQSCVGLLLDPGLGKTSISLAAFNLLGELGYTKGALVIAPLRAVYNVWPNEVRKWSDFKNLSVGILHGDDKDAVLKEDHHIYCINYEGIPWLVEKLLKMKEWPFDTLIADESTKLKDSSTQRFKAMRKIIHKFKRRYILTGTPTPNGLMDLFGQVYLLDLGNTLGKYVSHYRNDFFFQSGFGGYSWLPRLGAMEEIVDRIEPLVIRMSAEEYLTLPELVQDMVWLDLPAPARKIYKELESKYITEIGSGVITVPNAAAAGVKCRQVLNGAMYINAQHDWEVLHDVKLKALEDLMEQLSGAPLLILYEFKFDLERLLKKFPKMAVLGGQSMKKDQEVIEKFNRGELTAVAGHPASMGHALNLQGKCAHVCWYGLTWNFEHYDQAIKRVWRQGNDAPRVVVHHLCIRHSLDETVVETICAKDGAQEKFVRRIQVLANGGK